MNDSPAIPANSVPLTHRPFSQALKEARTAEKLTQAAVGELIGGSCKLIGHIEQGNSRPSTATYAKLVELMPVLAQAHKPRGMRPQRKRHDVAAKPVNTAAAAPIGYDKAIADVRAAKAAVINLEKAVEQAKARLQAAIKMADVEHRRMLASMTGGA